MARRFLFTAGTSVIGALENATRPSAGDEGRTPRLEELAWMPELDQVSRQPATDVSGADLTDVSIRLLRQLLADSNELDAFGTRCRSAAEDPTQTRTSLRALGAEGESIARRQRADGAEHIGPLGDDDEIVLLATDTVGGVLSACATVLLSGRRAVFRIATADGVVGTAAFDDPSDVSTNQPTSTVLIAQGMNAGSSQGIEGSSESLSRALREAATCEDGEPQQLIVEFSGGYKASIPLLLHLLEYLHSIEADAVVPELALFFRHEDEPDRWLHAPLRRLDRHTLDDHVVELATVARGEPVIHETLRGFGWDPHDGLTAVGRGALGLLRAYGYPRIP